MGDATGFEWADATWNPVVGCEIVSPGCTNCYAMGMAARIQRMAAGSGKQTYYAGTTKETKAGPVWTGKIAMAPEEVVAAPLRWRRPRRIFVNSMGDLFAPGVTGAMRLRAWAVMASAPWHTFMVLTKRPAEMRAWLEELLSTDELLEWVETLVDHPTGRRPLGDLVDAGALCRPLPNVWLGVTAEDQVRADERIPELLGTPAAVRFVSYEPAIGAVDLARFMWPVHASWPAKYRNPGEAKAAGAEVQYKRQALVWAGCRFVDWVICGGESGPGARPMHPEWARAVRDQCSAAGVPFFFKQWGEWVPVSQWPDTEEAYDRLYHPTSAGHPDATRRCKVEVGVVQLDGSHDDYMRAGAMTVFRVGKRTAGRQLGDRTHDAFPEARAR